MRGLVSVVTGPPTPQFFSVDPLQEDAGRNGATVVDTAVDWTTAALLFNRLKICASGSSTYLSRNRKTRLKPISNWVSRGVNTCPGATSCSVSDACVMVGSTSAFKPAAAPVASVAAGHCVQ